MTTARAAKRFKAALRDIKGSCPRRLAVTVQALLGRDGLLSQVTKAVLERALAEEMTGHLGYEKHDPAGRRSGNSRNGSAPETVLTDIGAVELAVPRDRAGSFEPQIVRKGQTRLEGFNDQIIALYAQGMTTRDIRGSGRASVADGTAGSVWYRRRPE